MVSYDVKDKGFSMHEMNMSCRSIERIRQGLFESLQNFEGAPSTSVREERVSDLKAAQAQARRELGRDVGLGFFVLLGNVSAMAGLSACTVATGGYCLLAVVGAISAKVGTVAATIDLAQTTNALSILEAELEAAEKKLNELNERRTDLDTARKLMISEFNSLCSQIRAQCL